MLYVSALFLRHDVRNEVAIIYEKEVSMQFRIDVTLSNQIPIAKIRKAKSIPSSTNEVIRFKIEDS